MSSRGVAVLAALIGIVQAGAWADCLTAEDGISAERPTGANTSPVVPPGSIQAESGLGLVRAQGATTYDLPQTRLRFGLGSCTEFLVDLPDYTHRSGFSGATDIAPGLMHQFTGLPEGLGLWAGIGVALPTGDRSLSGKGPAPYLQIPASYDLGGGLSVNAQYGVTFHPDDAGNDPQNQTSIYLDHTIGGASDVFVEYNNLYQHGLATQNSVDFGGSWRYAALRQIDMKVGFGINQAAPDWYFTIGYSLRFDHILF